MYKVAWKDSFSVEVEEIDNQHKKLINTINELIDLIEGNASEVTIDKIFNELTEYSQVHFATEEKYMKQFNYDELDMHLEEHAYFKNKIKEFKENYPKQSDTTKIELINFLKDWFLNHLMDIDKEYIETFKANGLK